MSLERVGEGLGNSCQPALVHVRHQLVDHQPLSEQRMGALLLGVGLQVTLVANL